VIFKVKISKYICKDVLKNLKFVDIVDLTFLKV